MPKIEIKSSDRVFVTGRTGSGKSVLVQKLIIPQLTNFVIYDYKHEIDVPGAELFGAIGDFKRRPNKRQIIYRPSIGSDEEFDALCRQVFYRGNNTLVLDETLFHCQPGRITPHHSLIMRLGRSKGVGIVNCTQRPRDIHNNVISQCEHFFIFDLTQDTDRKKVADFCGPQLLTRFGDKEFHFYYYNVKDKSPAFCRPVRL